jgi:outer membrane protein OmpA-like peptidoglycan-associated protein
VRRDWRERPNESRERRREEREKARQERRDEREQRRDEVQDERRDHAQDRRTEHLENRLKRLDEVQQQRRERVEDDGQRTIIEEPDKRVIIRDRGRVIIRHDETERFRRMRTVRDLRTERRADGTTVTVYSRPDGAEIVSEVDSEGRLLRRARRTREGREIVFIDNSRHYHHQHRRHRGAFLDVSVHLPAPIIRIPRHKYIVEYASASDDDIYEALSAPPIERLDRAYSLEEVRSSYHLRERMRRVDLDAINFEFGSWDVASDQYSKLERVAAAIRSVLSHNPDEVFLIEGHTDAVGSDVDNLSLSDRRAESVAVILSETFGVPPENLTTQGYGEQHLKLETQGPERVNRRVAVRRITPLLAPPAG